MVAVEDAFGAFQVEVVGRKFAPRQFHHRLQIVQLHTVLGTLLMQQVELVDFLAERLAHLLGPLLFLGSFDEFGPLWRTLAVAQLLLDVLDLLLQEIFALLFVDVLACL